MPCCHFTGRANAAPSQSGAIPDKYLAFDGHEAGGLAEYKTGSAEFAIRPDSAARSGHPTSTCFHRDATPAEDAAIEAGAFTGRCSRMRTTRIPGGLQPRHMFKLPPGHPPGHPKPSAPPTLTFKECKGQPPLRPLQDALAKAGLDSGMHPETIEAILAQSCNACAAQQAADHGGLPHMAAPDHGPVLPNLHWTVPPPPPYLLGHHRDIPQCRPTHPPKELAIRVQVCGTTVMAVYEVQEGSVLLTSADFGEGTAALGAATPDEAAAAPLRGMAEAGMAKGGPYMRDDELPSGRHGKG